MGEAVEGFEGPGGVEELPLGEEEEAVAEGDF